MLSVRPMASAVQEYSVFRLRISRATPPGSYLSRFALEDKEVPIAVDVEPREHLRFMPPRLVITATPDATVESELTIVNSGNAPFNLARMYSFCVFDQSGIDRAFFAALTDQAITGGQRLERFMDELANSHGGLVRLTVSKGTVVVPSGEARRIRIAIDCSQRLRPGQTYSGSWPLLNFKYPITLEVIDAKSHKAGGK